ncbi:MAG: cysteine/glutathione ABC transporter permease/ATP-binding protein CydD [Desulfobacterales bacterium]
MQPVKKSSHQNARRWLLKRASAARTWILISVALGLGSGLLLVVQARFLARIVHGAFIEGRGTDMLWPLFAILTGVIILRSILGWAREAAGFSAGARIRQEIRTELLEHIVSLGPGYTSRQSSGALASTALEHVEGLNDFYAFYLPQLALAVMIPAAIVAFVFPYSWAAGGLLLATAPLIPLFMILVGMGAESISQRHFQALSRMSAYFLDVLQGLSTLKLFNRSKGAEETIAGVSNNYRLRTMGVLRVAFLSSAVLEFFSSISIALVAVYLAMSYLGYFSFGLYGKSLNLAGGLFILLLAPDFYLPLRELGTHYHARAEAVGAAEEILKIASVSRLETLNGAIEWAKKDPLHIQLEDVHLSFDGGKRPALQGVSFELREGEQVALVGASGAGKTTTLSLLLGFLRPDSGQIRVNGMPLGDMTPDSWRRHIAWIGQHPVLFHGTIKENILLGRPEASAMQIEQAAGNARVLDFAMHLPEGLDTSVGEQGFGLSRGQAQRVALARIFLKDAPLLLLDEPTTGLDAENEALVINSLETLSRGRTVLMLTHRLTNIRETSRIIVLEKGRIVEQGTYGELTAAGGRFNRMVNQT